MDFGFPMAGIISGAAFGIAVALLFLGWWYIDRHERNAHGAEYLIVLWTGTVGGAWVIASIGALIGAAVF